MPKRHSHRSNQRSRQVWVTLGAAGLGFAVTCFMFAAKHSRFTILAVTIDLLLWAFWIALASVDTLWPKLSKRNVENHEAEQAIAQLVDTFCASVELKDPYTRGHSERVTAYLLFLAEKVFRGLPDRDRQKLRYAGLLHDIGKIHIPENILKKPAKLSAEEMLAIRQHPRIGADIISHIPSLSDTIPIILHHHERYDGRGYPARLKGQDIPLEARIASLADTFDAMTSTRAYRNALSLDEALQEIIANSGSQFDPAIVNVLVREYDGLRRLYHHLHHATRQPSGA